MYITLFLCKETWYDGPHQGACQNIIVPHCLFRACCILHNISKLERDGGEWLERFLSEEPHYLVTVSLSQAPGAPRSGASTGLEALAAGDPAGLIAPEQQPPQEPAAVVWRQAFARRVEFVRLLQQLSSSKDSWPVTA